MEHRGNGGGMEAMKAKILFLTLVFCFSHLSVLCAQEIFLEKATDEEYKVYCEVLMQTSQGDKPFFIVYDTTANLASGMLQGFDRKTADYIKEQSGVTLDEDLIADFENKNKAAVKLEAKFTYNKNLSVVIAPRKDIDDIFSSQEDGWEEFYKKYPGSTGTTELSRVGFNKDMTMALVYFGNQRHWLAGAGYYVILKKEDGNWTVLASAMAWIS